MIRRRFLSLLLMVALFLLPGCGIPNYFDYESDFDFTTQIVSTADSSAAIYLSPDILNRIGSGTIEPIPTTPRIYLLYSISGTDSSNTSLISAFNSAYRSSISSYPDDWDGFIKSRVAPASGEDSIYFALFPFHDEDNEQVSLTADMAGFDADGLYRIQVRQKSVEGGFVIELSYGNGETMDLYRYNDEVFKTGITNYDANSTDEFQQDRDDGDANKILSPRIRVYLASTMGFMHYTNFMYAKMIEIASFSI